MRVSSKGGIVLLGVRAFGSRKEAEIPPTIEYDERPRGLSLSLSLSLHARELRGLHVRCGDGFVEFVEPALRVGVECAAAFDRDVDLPPTTGTRFASRSLLVTTVRFKCDS